MLLSRSALGLGIIGEMRGQDLDRDGAVEARITRAIHFAHAARAQPRLDFIRSEVRARGKGHPCA